MGVRGRERRRRTWDSLSVLDVSDVVGYGVCNPGGKPKRGLSVCARKKGRKEREWSSH